MIVTVEYEHYCQSGGMVIGIQGDRNSRVVYKSDALFELKENMDATRHVHLVYLRINHMRQ